MLLRRLAPLGDRPHHQRLTAAHVARRKHPRYDGFMYCPSVSTFPRRRASTFNCSSKSLLLRTRESHRNQHEVGVDREIRPGDRCKRRRRTDPHQMQPLHVPLLITFELRRRNAPLPHATLFMRCLRPQLHRPERPRRGSRTLLRRLRHDLQADGSPLRPDGSTCQDSRHRCRRHR